jgi:hypothetical protein
MIASRAIVYNPRVFVFSPSNLGTALLIGGGGLVVTIAAIAGIVVLARTLGKTKSTGTLVAAIFGIIFLAAFVLVGLFATGCGAFIAAQ